jgi:hypothetical protein
VREQAICFTDAEIHVLGLKAGDFPLFLF